MKLVLKVIVCITTIILLAVSPVFATGNDEVYDELIDKSGVFDLEIPKQSEEFLSSLDAQVENPQSLLNISFGDFVGGIFKEVKGALSKPITIFTTAIAAMLLCAILNSVKSGFNSSSYGRIFSTVSVICVCGTVIVPVHSLLKSCSEVISVVTKFMLSFVPVYSGIIASSGKPILATAYQLSVVGVIQLIAEISAVVIVPLLSIYLAFCLIGSTSSQINTEGIARGVKRTATVILTFLLSVFVGLLTVQSIVASSTDSLSLKTAKFAVSTFLPVVGSAMSEALSSISGSMGLMKSAVGGFSIFALIGAFLPSVISIVLTSLSMGCAAAVGDMLGTTEVASLMRSVNSVLSILLGVVLTFFAMMAISIGIMLTIGG